MVLLGVNFDHNNVMEIINDIAKLYKNKLQSDHDELYNITHICNAYFKISAIFNDDFIISLPNLFIKSITFSINFFMILGEKIFYFFQHTKTNIGYVIIRIEKIIIFMNNF